MARWRFTQTYRSSYGAGTVGDEVDLEDGVAEAINRDAPGTLEPMIEPMIAAAKAPTEPAANRQIRKRG